MFPLFIHCCYSDILERFYPFAVSQFHGGGFKDSSHEVTENFFILYFDVSLPFTSFKLYMSFFYYSYLNYKGQIETGFVDNFYNGGDFTNDKVCIHSFYYRDGKYSYPLGGSSLFEASDGGDFVCNINEVDGYFDKFFNFLDIILLRNVKEYDFKKYWSFFNYYFKGEKIIEFGSFDAFYDFFYNKFIEDKNKLYDYLTIFKSNFGLLGGKEYSADFRGCFLDFNRRCCSDAVV